MSSISIIFSFWTSKEKKRAWIAILMAMVMAVLEMLGIVSILPFLSILSDPSSTETNTWLKKIYLFYQNLGVASKDDFLIALGVTCIALTIIAAIFRSMTQYYLHNFIEFSRFSLSTQLLQTFLFQPYRYFLAKDTAELTKIIINEVDYYIEKIFRPIILGIANAIVALALLALLMLINPTVALLTLALVSCMYFFLFKFFKDFLSRSGDDLTLALTNRFSAVTDAFALIKPIKLSGSESLFLDRFKDSAEVFKRSMVGYIVSNQISSYIIEAMTISALFIATIFLIISSGGVQSDFFSNLLPLLGLYAFVILKIKPLAHTVYQGFASARYGSASIEILIQALKDITSYCTFPNKDSCESSQPVSNTYSHVALKNIAFKYENSSDFEIKDISLNIKRGQKIGIVGTSGSGKSTLVDIILGLLRPTSGSIMIDGQPLTEKNVSSWQSKLGYVPQDVVLTNRSIKENIAFNLPVHEINDVLVRESIIRSHLNEFLDAHEEGHDLIVGDQGIKLSGGQKQRVGIARSLYNDPQLIVFDEATSSLDSASANKVLQSIYMLDKRHTVIIITHQPDTLKNCDVIYSMENGEIKFHGSFDELTEYN
jgi:ATP-binding cassette, subfamily B, bacterial PglK